jgi:hypothetical protein
MLKMQFQFKFKFQLTHSQTPPPQRLGWRLAVIPDISQGLIDLGIDNPTHARVTVYVLLRQLIYLDYIYVAVNTAVNLAYINVSNILRLLATPQLLLLLA